LLFGFAEPPIFEQFRLVQLCPIENEIHRPPWQLAFRHFQRANVDDRLVVAVFSVKVRWRVFIPEHLDDDSEELADSCHVAYRAFASSRLKR